MPRKPRTNVAKLESTKDILNSIRNEAGGEYADLVPECDGSIASIRHIGDIMMTYTAVANTFLDVLVNRIGLVYIKSRMYTNPWAMFKKGMMELGETVEEIWVDLATPYEFNRDRAESNVFKQVKPNVQVAFHHLNYRKFYKVTVTEDELRQAFTSMQGVVDLISRIIESLVKSANYDEFITMKYLIGRMAINGNLYPAEIPEVSASNSDAIVTVVKEISNTIEFLKRDYNSAHVANATEKSRQYLISTAKFSAVNDVSTLAKAFNMEKAEFLGHQVMVDSFRPSDTEIARYDELFDEDEGYVEFTDDELALLDSIPAMLIDDEFFMIFDNMLRAEAIRNPEGLYNNHFLHKWSIFSCSPFANAILFTTTEPTVTSVTVSPSSATVVAGATQQLVATVVVTGFADKSVEWSISGQTSEDTTIDQTGKLTVGDDETDAGTITVTATSTFDDSKSDTSTITVSNT